MLLPSGGKRSRSLKIGCPHIPSAESVVSEGTWCCITASTALFPSVDAWIADCSLFVLGLTSSQSGISSSCRPLEYLRFSCLKTRNRFYHDPLMTGKFCGQTNYFLRETGIPMKLCLRDLLSHFYRFCNNMNIVNFSWHQWGTWFTQK